MRMGCKVFDAIPLTPLNLDKKYAVIFVQIKRSSELRVHFNIGS